MLFTIEKLLQIPLLESILTAFASYESVCVCVCVFMHF